MACFSPVKLEVETYRMDGESGGINGFVSFNDGALLIHKNQVRHFDLTKVHRQGV